MPIGPRIVRLFGTKNLSKLVQDHGLKINDISETLKDYHDTETWKKKWFGEDGLFHGDPKGLAFNLSTDGMCPWKDKKYSMWPISLQLLNYPPSLRKKINSLFLSGVVPGSSVKKGCEAKSLEPYLGILVDEILELSDVELHDSYTDLPFNLKAKLVHYILDFPGISKVLNLPAQGAIKACPWCDVTGYYCKCAGKTIYLENRRFLPADSPLRFDKVNFPFGQTEEKHYPTKPDNTEMNSLRTRYDQLPNDAQKKKFSKMHGVKGNYQLNRMESHGGKDDISGDFMHTLKNFLQRVLNIISGKNVSKIAAADKEARSHEEIDEEVRRWLLSREEKDLVQSRCKKVMFSQNHTGDKGNIIDENVLSKTQSWQEVNFILISLESK